jgi:putative transposase
MPNYRRLYRPGGSWFFSVNLADRRSTLLTDRIAALQAAIRRTKRQLPFRIEAMVILPDHIHAIWTLPPDDTDFPTRWRLIKTRLVKSVPAFESRDCVRLARGERGLWQRRYWEHVIRDERDYRRHVRYCYFNPVKHGLVENVRDWPFSTYHRDVRAGIFAEDFAFDGVISGAFGESTEA